MKKTITVAIASLVVAAAPSAFAEGWYADGGYTFIGIDTDVADVDLGAITAHGGFDFNENFGIEGEAAFGVADEDFSDGINSASIDLSYLVGVYGKVQMPVGENVNLFARAGLVNAELDVEVTGLGTTSESDTGAGFGVGGTFAFSERMFVRGDYTRYDIEDLEADAFTVALGAKF